MVHHNRRSSLTVLALCCLLFCQTGQFFNEDALLFTIECAADYVAKTFCHGPSCSLLWLALGFFAPLPAAASLGFASQLGLLTSPAALADSSLRHSLQCSVSHLDWSLWQCSRCPRRTLTAASPPTRSSKRWPLFPFPTLRCLGSEIACVAPRSTPAVRFACVSAFLHELHQSQLVFVCESWLH